MDNVHRHILHIEKNIASIDVLKQSLSAAGFELTVTEDTQTALKKLESGIYTLIIKDISEGCVDVDILNAAKVYNPEAKTILLVDTWDTENWTDKHWMYSDDILLKPYSISEYMARVALWTRKIRRASSTPKGLMIPVCWSCKKIRDDHEHNPGTGLWLGFDDFFLKKFGMLVTRSYCPECVRQAL